ncbi:MAG: hypothetical protein Q7T40_00495 [Methylobacter sp.]|nr:hypothetical protein [Methylobacter sp.]
MKTRIMTALVLIVLAIIGIGPIPTTSLIAVYVVIFRPSWFKHLVDTIYR